MLLCYYVIMLLNHYLIILFNYNYTRKIVLFIVCIIVNVNN